MRRVLVHLLMLVMLMPGMACGPFMAASKARAADVPVKAEMPACHGMSAHRGMDARGTMLFKDCAKADLCGVDGVTLKNPDMVNTVFIAWADPSLPQPLFTPARSGGIRGPPPDGRGLFLSSAGLSVILTTGRFRV